LKLQSTPDLEQLAEESRGDTPKTIPRPMSAMSAAVDADRTQIQAPLTPTMTAVAAASPQAATMTMGARAVRVNESSVLTVPDADAIEAPAHAPQRTQRPFLWMAVGFFSVIALAIFLGNRAEKRQREEDAQKPEGTPVRLHRPNEKTEEIRLVEFRTEGPDPSQWIFVYERQTPDGKWVRESTTYKNGQNEKTLMEFLPKP
jgi:hypothetical protein